MPESEDKLKHLKMTGRPSVSVTDEAKFKDVMQAFDELQRHSLNVSLEVFDKSYKVSSDGSSLYEKVFLVDGAAIALSLTLLSNLSTRLAAAHAAVRPHLWLIGTSWFLLVASMYCCYRVIFERHAAAGVYLHTVSNGHQEYENRRIALLIAVFSRAVGGTVEVASEEIPFATLAERFDIELKNDVEERRKATEARWAALKKTSSEGVMSKVAMVGVILGVGFLCAFTLQSLRLFF